MKIAKNVLQSFLLVALTALTQQVFAQTYKINVSVENENKSIGAWTQVATVQQLKKGVEPIIFNLVSPTKVVIDNKTYDAGFNIKFNLSQAPNANGSFTNYLTLAATYTTPQMISLYTQKIEKDETTLAPGKVYISPTANMLNSVRFIKVYDVTEPRNIPVSIARFSLDDEKKKSLVTLKLQVQKVK